MEMPDVTYATNPFGQPTAGYIGLKEVIGRDSGGPAALHMPLGTSVPTVASFARPQLIRSCDSLQSARMRVASRRPN